MATRLLVEGFNVDHSTTVRRLKKLEEVCKLARWFPHELSDDNKPNHIAICYGEMRKTISEESRQG